MVLSIYILTCFGLSQGRHDYCWNAWLSKSCFSESIFCIKISTGRTSTEALVLSRRSVGPKCLEAVGNLGHRRVWEEPVMEVSALLSGKMVELLCLWKEFLLRGKFFYCAFIDSCIFTHDVSSNIYLFLIRSLRPNRTITWKILQKNVHFMLFAQLQHRRFEPTSFVYVLQPINAQ